MAPSVLKFRTNVLVDEQFGQREVPSLHGEVERLEWRGQHKHPKKKQQEVGDDMSSSVKLNYRLPIVGPNVQISVVLDQQVQLS